MTATTKASAKHKRRRSGTYRFIAMESLGFSDSVSTWSDSPVVVPMEVLDSEPAVTLTVVDQAPGDFGKRLDGRDVRWGVLAVIAMLTLGVAIAALWLYRRPMAQAESSLRAVTAEATALEATLPELEAFNAALVEPGSDLSTYDVSTVGTSARRLFDLSGSLPGQDEAIRSAAAGAAGSALDGVRLAGNTRAYMLAVIPHLSAPGLETDPSRISLDDAARAFGDWQLSFDQMRRALPADVFSPVTDQIAAVSSDLPGVLDDYVEALRLDDQPGAARVLSDLDGELGAISVTLAQAVADVHERVDGRIAETRAALAAVIGS